MHNLICCLRADKVEYYSEAWASLTCIGIYKAQAKQMQHVAYNIVGSCCNMSNRVGQTNATLCNLVAKRPLLTASAILSPILLPSSIGPVTPMSLSLRRGYSVRLLPVMLEE